MDWSRAAQSAQARPGLGIVVVSPNLRRQQVGPESLPSHTHSNVSRASSIRSCMHVFIHKLLSTAVPMHAACTMQQLLSTVVDAMHGACMHKNLSTVAPLVHVCTSFSPSRLFPPHFTSRAHPGAELCWFASLARQPNKLLPSSKKMKPTSHPLLSKK